MSYQVWGRGRHSVATCWNIAIAALPLPLVRTRAKHVAHAVPG